MSVHTATGIRCGNRRQHGADVVYHASTQDVKDCYAESGRFQTFDPIGRASNNLNPDVEAIREQARREQEARDAAVAEAERIARNARYATWRTIPVYSRDRGYYALGSGDDMRFYRIERPSKGKWAGRTFVTVQASDAFHKLPYAMAAEVMDAIAADPTTAARLYGSEINQCSRCNRTLTDTVSRERGMGPDCSSKY